MDDVDLFFLFVKCEEKLYVHKVWDMHIMEGVFCAAAGIKNFG